MSEGTIRLNRYLAMCGAGARRGSAARESSAGARRRGARPRRAPQQQPRREHDEYHQPGRDAHVQQPRQQLVHEEVQTFTPSCRR